MTSSQLTFATLFESGARFDKTRTYRYYLWRVFDPKLPRVCFIGLNPSKADEMNDDPTIRKCLGFAQRWGYGGIDMVNLFALVSTKPEGLLQVKDPIGPGNHQALTFAFEQASLVVPCWGDYPVKFRALIRNGKDRTPGLPSQVQTKVLGFTQSGAPKHPARIAYDTPLVPVTPSRVFSRLWGHRVKLS
jgi:hypothetical protein